MNRKEFCQEYGVSESTVKTNFPSVQKSFLKKGLVIKKLGRGDKAEYTVTSVNERAVTMLKEAKSEILMTKDEFKSLKDFRFIVFLGIVTTPNLVFRGTVDQLLDYIEVTKNEYNRQLIRDSLQDLIDAKFIVYMDDTSTDEGYFIAAVARKTERDMSLGIEMVRHCKELSDKYNKKFSDLIKVWTALGYAYYHQPFTVAQLEELTGLSAYKIREAKKILLQDDLFTSSKCYIKDEDGKVYCTGQLINVNVIKGANKEILRAVQENPQLAPKI